MIKLIYVLVGRGIPAAGAVFFSLILAKLLNISDADKFFLWLTVIYLSSYFTRLGFDLYLLKTRAVASGYVSSVKRHTAIYSLLISVALLYFSPQDIWPLVMSLPLFSLVCINSTVFRVDGKDFLGAFFEISCILLVSLLMLLIVAGFKDKIIVFDVSVVFFASAFIVFCIGELLLGKYQFIFFKGTDNVCLLHIKESVKFIPSPIMIYLVQWMPLFYLAHSYEGEVAQYSVAVRLATGFAFLAISVDAYLAPRFSSAYAEKNFSQLKSFIRNVRNYAGSGAMLIFVLYGASGEYLIRSFLGEDYVASFYVSLVLSVTYIAVLFIGPYQFLLLICGGEKFVNKCNFLVLCSVILIGGILGWLHYSSIYFAILVCSARIISFFAMSRVSVNKYLKEV